jgi:hypothetical protein
MRASTSASQACGSISLVWIGHGFWQHPVASPTQAIPRKSFVFVLLIVILAASVGGVYIWDQLPISVGRQTEYARLRLGMNQDEVMYIKGYPSIVLAEELTDPAWKGFLV